MDRQAAGQAGKAQAFAAGARSVMQPLTVDSHMGAAQGLSGFAMGARVATMDGLLPVEYLNLGDRIITRSGARVLRGISALPMVSNLVRIAQGALGHDRPGAELVLGGGTEVLLRDWRARALFGKAQALVSVVRLIDGQFVTRVSGAPMRLFALHFDVPEVIYADGVEVGCAPIRVAAQG